MAHLYLLTVFLLVTSFCVGEDDVEPLPRIPATESSKAPESFQLQDGFSLELIAAEPMVTDPVAMAYDENGLAYVVEMNDYPYTDKSLDKPFEEQQSRPIGKIRLLEDTDNDGKFDRSVVFADQLSWPTGVACWKGGIFVTATPDIWYLKDTNQDGQADIRKKVFTGFRKYNVQAVMNNLKWGMDHRIYAAGSSNGGNVRPGDDPGATAVTFRRNDIRLNPVSNSIEALAGGARFGNCFDDWGNRFICNIRNPIQNIVIPNRYVKRNPYLNLSTTLHDVAESGDAVQVYRISPPEPWRVINAQRLASNISSLRTPRSEMHATGFVTSASGITIYRGKAYPEKYENNVFIGEVAGNLVVRYLLSKEGPTFSARRAIDQEEFLASTDNWFRPVNFINAPDGTLHLLDMYRETIEHPWSIPDDIKARVDLESGRNRGRIYRLVPPQYSPGYPILQKPQLGKASTTELVKQLENPNSWWRETAHRLIFERQDSSAIALLKKLLSQGKTDQSRLLALWSLRGLNALEESDLLTALNDSSGRVRRHAVLLSETKLNDTGKLAQKVMSLSQDPVDLVRFQVALSLGEIKKEAFQKETGKALSSILDQDGKDFWIRTAVLSSLSGKELEIAKNLRDVKKPTPEQIETMNDLCVMITKRGDSKEMHDLLDLTMYRDDESDDTMSFQLSEMLDQMVLQIGKTLRQSGQSLDEYTEKVHPEMKWQVGFIMLAAENHLFDPEVGIDAKKDYITELSFGPFLRHLDVWKKLLSADQPVEIQKEVVSTLQNYTDTEVAHLMIEQYRSMTPDVQRDMVATMLRRTNWVIPLFEAIKQNKIPSGQISSIHRTIYKKHSNEEIKKMANELFASESTGLKKEIIESYNEAISRKGNEQQGKTVFEKECMICHKLEGKGHNVGPNLATVQNRSRGEILAHILDPNREVSPNYQEYAIVTNDGQIKTGIISAETPATITITLAEGKTEQIPREEIETLQSTGKSMMPEGLEKKITKEQMADLISYILSVKK